MKPAATDTPLTLRRGDCLGVLSRMEPASVDLVFASPPYERARKYDELNFSLRGLAWAAWCADRFEACLRVSRGLVAWVVGHGSSGAVAPWSAAPALLIAELHSRGVHLLRPCWYRRHGIPGAGGKQWFSPKIEWIVCATSAPNGRLPYAQVTAELGHAPKGPPVGPMSCRLRDGSRCVQRYKPPKRSNPGDVFDIGAVGGGRIGNGLAHENEAPFPEALAEPFVRAFCPPGGVVLDPFCGSGTTLAVALRHGRRAVGIDARQSQIELSRLRCRSEFTLFHSEIER